MNIRSRFLRRGTTALAVAGLLAAGLVGGTATAADSDTPPWQAAANADPNAVRTLAFFDASGNQVFSGSTSAPVSAYVVSSGVVRAGDDHANLYAYTPVAGQAPGAWSTGTQLTAAGQYPIAGAPASISSTLPAYKGTAGDTSIADHITAFPNSSTAAGYAGVYELRLRTSSSTGTPPLGPDYAVADIKVTGDTWSVVYGSKTTSTVSTVVPAKATYGTAYKITATASATGTVPTGTATLKSGSTTVSTVTLAAGKATFTVAGTKFAPGKRSFTVTYNGSGAVGASTSTAKSVTIAKAVAKATNVLNVKTIKHTKAAKLTVKVTATGVVPTGKVTIYDGTKVIKTVTLTAAAKGKLVVTLPKLKKGSHKIHAVYAGSTYVLKATAANVVLKST